LIALAEKQGCHLLVDETYRDLSYGAKLPSAASLSKRAISVASLSKAYGIPGIRVGWLVTQDAALYERFLAAKEQIAICGSILDEIVALQMLQNRDAFLARVLPDMRARLDIVQQWIAGEKLVDWVRPSGGVVGFPRLNVPASFDAEGFYKTLLEEYGTYVGPGHWFEMPRTFFRIGFGWPTVAALESGLDSISSALKPYR
jgi:aspartate/methionine/tyrosine aminotransferase